MRNVTAKLSILVFLGLLVFHGVSGAFSYDWKGNLSTTQRREAMENGLIQCHPQYNSSANLWDCEDAYGNQYTNLKIVQVK